MSSHADASFIARAREVLSQPYTASGKVSMLQAALSDRDKAASQETAYVAGVGDTTQAVGRALEAGNGDTAQVGGFLQSLMAETARQGYGQPSQPAQPARQRAPLAIESGSQAARPAFGQASRRG